MKRQIHKTVSKVDRQPKRAYDEIKLRVDF